MTKKVIIGSIIFLTILILYFLVKNNTCSIERGWDGKIQTCTCQGYEVQIKNDLQVDGDRITVCLGIIRSIDKLLQTEKDLPTPNLIHKDYTNEKITLEQKWLYMMYAFYDYEKLPNKYKSNVGWRGTEYLLEFNKLVENSEVCKFSKESIVELESGFSQNFDCE